MWFPRFFLEMLVVALVVYGNTSWPKALLAADGQAARETIIEIHRDHPDCLSECLESDSNVRGPYLGAYLDLAWLSEYAPPDDPERDLIYEFSLNLVTDNLGVPGRIYLEKRGVYDTSITPIIAYARERFYRTWKDSLPLTDARKSEIAESGNFSPQQRDILVDHDVLVMDNCRLDSAQLAYLDSLLSLVPASLHDLGAVGVDVNLPFWPLPEPEMGWWDFFSGKGGEINTFGVRISDSQENPFPDDVSPSMTATFCACAAHEVNHIVDAYGISGNPPLNTRKNALIQAAGSDHMNYLRSMFPDGFFLSAPQEFFASIANQWFTDSAKTVELGLVRFDDGRLDPINQAVFFAEVYSEGGESTWFYTTDVLGNLVRQSVPLQRDAQGHINQLTFDDNVYTFTLDTVGNVTSYHVVIIPEPSSLALLSMGTLALLAYAWRRRRRR